MSVEFEGGIEKSIPRIIVWHHKACRVKTNGDREERILKIRPEDHRFNHLLVHKDGALFLRQGSSKM